MEEGVRGKEYMCIRMARNLYAKISAYYSSFTSVTQ